MSQRVPYSAYKAKSENLTTIKANALPMSPYLLATREPNKSLILTGNPLGEPITYLFLCGDREKERTLKLLKCLNCYYNLAYHKIKSLKHDLKKKKKIEVHATLQSGNVSYKQISRDLCNNIFSHMSPISLSRMFRRNVYTQVPYY